MYILLILFQWVLLKSEMLYLKYSFKLIKLNSLINIIK